MHMSKRRTERNPMAVTMVVLLFLMLTVLIALPTALADNGGGPPPKMDIYVTGIELSNVEPLQDDEVNVTATVLSNMTAPVSNVTVVFSVNMRAIGNVSNLTLMPGTPLEVSTVWVANTGTQVVNATVFMGGVALRDSTYSVEVYVEAKPVGDVPTLLCGLLAIALVVLGVAIAPSLISRLMP